MVMRWVHTVWVCIFFVPLTCSADEIRLARFDIDVTPPVGFSMAYDPVRRTEELGLRCRGVVLLGADQPMVVCAVDWIGIGNESHDLFRQTIADAAGTIPQRVAVQTLHQHDAPRCDFTAERLLRDAGLVDLGAFEGAFARQVLQRLKRAVRKSLTDAVSVTHASIGEANVEKVASNRRIQDEAGKVVQTRYTTCRDPGLRQLPEGIIDPVLSTVAFWNNETPVAVLSYYACHPQSYYRTGVPSPDFPGIARFLRGQDMPDVLHVHFNGAGGNIGAGKYNDGAKENRLILAKRVADGMRRSFEDAKKFPLSAEDLGWYVAPVALPLGNHLKVEELRQDLTKWQSKDYWGSPEQLAFALRCEGGHQTELSCLRVGNARVLHMPGELFVEYQLAAKRLRPNLQIAMAAYGDYGPGYIGTAESYGQGGYETSERASKVGPGVEHVLMEGVKKLLEDADEKGDEFARELPRIPPLSPQEALKTFRVADGYEMQLVASEPLTGSPVAVEWDADGRMYVCEMRGYSENRDDRISTIGLLTDVDGDGAYDSRVTFADGLRWPTAIFPFDGGLFVGDAPDIFYLKDTDGDGVADLRKEVLTGFGHSNVQGLLNSMRWGLDNSVHVACSSVGGQIRRTGSESPALNIRGRDLRFDPRSFEFQPTSGAAQHGMCFDDWGRKFVSSNSDHIQQVMYEDHHTTRNSLMKLPGSRVSIAVDGPQAEVFRISPVEPWRIVRTRLRVAGQVPGPIEGGGRPAGYFTGATGVTIYRGDAWPKSHHGLAIVGDVGSNLIHRKRLTSDGVQFQADRMDTNSEFVASTDIWFRPSQFANAPDGSLFVIDTCREVIEHPRSLPPGIKQHLDLTAGRDRGRIYRLAPQGFVSSAPPALSRVSSEELVAFLSHTNAWHRETAARLLFERQDKSVISGLEDTVRKSDSPQGRMHGLYALEGLDALTGDLLRHALKDHHPQVRRHAVRLVERGGLCDSLFEDLARLANDASLEVRIQLAYALGACASPDRIPLIAQMIRRDVTNVWAQVAAQSSLTDSAAPVFRILLSDEQFRSQPAGRFLSELLYQVCRQDLETDINDVVDVLSSQTPRDPMFVLPLSGQVLAESRRSKGSLNRLLAAGRLSGLQTNVGQMVSQMKIIVADATNAVENRCAAIRMLKFGEWDQVSQTVEACLGPHESHEVQVAALKTIGGYVHRDVAVHILNAWPAMSPRLRSAAMEILFARTERVRALLNAVTAGDIPASDLPAVRLERLASSASKDIAGQAKRLLQSRAVSPRSAVVDGYSSSLRLNGDIDHGRIVFRKQCSGCHRVDGFGHELGPHLAAAARRGAETILLNVLDPNREVNPQYANYIAVTTEGRSVTGMIASENANSVTLRRAEGASDTLLRSDVDELQSSGVSLMPVGFEKSIDQQAMADLIAYLMQAK